MATADLIQELNTDLLDAYAAIEEKGGTVPEQKNTSNLAEAIRSIEGGDTPTPPLPDYPYHVDDLDGGEFGAVAYLRSGEVGYYTATSSSDLTNVAAVSENRVIKQLDDGFNISSNNILAYAVGSSAESLGNNFLYGCPLLQQFFWAKDNHVTTIGTRFLYNCTGFLQPMKIPNGITTIGNNFMQGCTSFNQPITLPNTLTAIDNSFLSGCSSFNQPLVIPESVGSIGNNFMLSCKAYNEHLTLPDGLTKIGQSFMEGDDAFAQLLTLPDTVTTVGDRFMYACNNFTKLHVGKAYGFVSSNYVLSTAYSGTTAPMYVEGVTLTGESAEGWIAGLPNRDSSPWRKLINGNA